MNLFISLLPVLLQLFFGLRDRSYSNNLSVPSVNAPMMACDRRSDSLELVKFYNATGGPSWWKKWDLTKPITSWHGIELENGCVVAIDLDDTIKDNTCCNGSGNNLTGPLVSLNLSQLRLLNLGKNKLSGSIPNFDMISNLVTLDLYGNKITGSVPNFDKLPKLDILDLGGNQLTGTIPNFDKLLLLSKLHIEDNQLTALPNFNNLPNLKTINLSSNRLTGTIPNFTLPNLITIDLANNKLSGTIPNFNNLSNLESLFLRINQLSGDIPNFNNLPNLVNLNLRNNLLTGSMPPFNKNSIKLGDIDFSLNKLTGPIPDLNSLPNLVHFRLSFNQLSGVIPSFSSNRLLKTIQLNDNFLTGKIPTFSNQIELSILWIHNNQLTGSMPNYYINNPKISYLTTQENYLTFSSIIHNVSKNKQQADIINKDCSTCDYDTLIYAPQKKVFSDTAITIFPNTNYTLDLLIDDTVTTSTYYWYKNDTFIKTIKGSNKLPFTPFTSNDAGTYTVKITNPLAPQLTLESWPIRLVASPSLVCDRRSDSLELIKFFSATGGSNWWKKWDLTMPISTWWGISINNDGCVTEIRLNDTTLSNCCVGNNLQGGLIELNLQKLTYLNLWGNNLTGSIPNFDLPSLQTLRLEVNKFTGNIPPFDKLPQLGYLALEGNQLTGSIPNFDKLTNLYRIGAYWNQLTGPVPNFKLPLLNRIHLNGNKLRGPIPLFDSTPNLETINLFDNELTGSIPDFANLPILKVLALHHNLLSGSLPSFNKNLILENLEVHNNKLQGMIPDLSHLKNLGSMTLSDNSFTGPLPNLNKFPNLREVWLANNNFTGFLDDYRTSNPLLRRGTFEGNKHTFSDIIKNHDKIKTLIEVTNQWSQSRFSYAPQQKIYSDTTIIITPNTNYTLDLFIDDTVTTSTYTWYKNGILDTVIKGSNKLPFTPFMSNDAGTYTVKITNPLAPQLALESWPIRLLASTSMVCDRRSDSLELLKLFRAVKNPLRLEWQLNVPLKEWKGITLNTEGCVETIDKSNQSIETDSFPDMYLPYLKSLNFHNNLVSGQLPNFNLPNVEYISFQSNKLNGTLPDFNKMPNLKELNFFQNNMAGVMPPLSALVNLEKLILWHNSLSGQIPQIDLPKIKILDISGNPFSGTIPNFSKMPSLEQLDIYNGGLVGPLPNFNFLPKLKRLNAFNQNITGAIPDFTNLPDLLSLNLHSNYLTGTIPKFNNSPKLEGLDLSYCFISGVIPDFYKSHLNLSDLAYEENKFTFQSMVHNLNLNKNHVDIKNKNCPNCTSDTLRYAQQKKIYVDTTITIPLCTVYTLDLKIDDTVTTSTYAWFKDGIPDTIIIGNNKRRFTNFNSAYVGTYTVKITNPLAPQLTLESHPIRLAVGTGLCCDRRSDSLELLNFFKTTGGPGWTNKQGWVDPTKPLTMWYGVSLNSMGCVQAINLNGNKVTGKMPNLNLMGLETLSLQGNSLTDTIPNFDKLPNLGILNLGQNQLSESIPNFDKLPNLGILRLSGNQLKRSIPIFDKLTSLNRLYIGENNLSGPIPNFNLPNLWTLDLSSNQLIGPIPNFDKLPSLLTLDLRSNQLTGMISNFINMPDLIGLYLNDNKLTFENIIQNVPKVGYNIEVVNGQTNGFIYAPQQKIFFDTTINIPSCTDYTLDIKIDDTVTTSTYAWSKNGSPFMTIKGSNKLTFKNFTSANNGTYTVSITNPLAPQLTLESHPIRLTSSGALANINNPRDTSLSCGFSFTLRPITGQNLTNPAYFTGAGRTGIQYNAGQVITSSTTLYVHSGAGNCADEDTFRIQFVPPTFILIPDIVKVKFKTPTPFDVLANDQIPVGLSPIVVIDPSQLNKIIYSQSTGRGTYTPNDNFSGKEILNYTVCINGCANACKSSTITFEVEGPCGDRNSLVLPNIIFPTGSGANRYFIVEAITKCPNSWGPKPHKLEVFNRWGDRVFFKDNYLNDWDGTNTAGQPLPAGTYYYLLDLGSVAAPVKGYVAIVR